MEKPLSDLMSVAQAIAILDAVPVHPRSSRVPLAKAMGLRLAEDLRADRDFPPMDKSQMDGYAVRCADVAGVPVELEMVAEITAGSAADQPVLPGQAMAIMTGAPLPSGADGVVPVEDTALDGDSVRILKSALPGRYIATRGCDMKAGHIVLQKGMLFQAPQLGVAASIGAAEIPVFDRPRVGVLATGDELVPIDQTPLPAQIRNGNSPMLLALIAKWGCKAIDLGMVPDEPEKIRAAISSRVDKLDALLITGGMSAGSRDFVPGILQELGFQLKISRLKIKPGKPFIFGLRGEKGPFVFGLPGNPVSAFVCAVRLVSRLLARLSGGEAKEKWLAGRLDVGLPANGPREFYHPVIWSAVQGGTSARSEFASVTPLNWKNSADLFTLAHANALLVRHESEPPLGKGTLVRVLEI
jgi:molybdopterin molybdotransferase